MVFKDWEINVVYSGKHEVVTNENSLFVIDEDMMSQSQSII